MSATGDSPCARGTEFPGSPAVAGRPTGMPTSPMRSAVWLSRWSR